MLMKEIRWWGWIGMLLAAILISTLPSTSELIAEGHEADHTADKQEATSDTDNKKQESEKAQEDLKADNENLAVVTENGEGKETELTEKKEEQQVNGNRQDNKNYRVIGYYTQWSTYGRDFQVLDMDASKLTHILYAFADYCWEGKGHSDASACEGEANGTVISADPWADYDNPHVLRLTEEEVWTRDFAGNLGALVKLKDKYPHLRTILSIGGWTFSKNFSHVAASEDTRKQFAQTAVQFIRKYEMDGIDIDWEYPVSGGLEGNVHRPEDKQNHTLLLEAIRTELNKAEKEDGKKYELSIASSASPSYLENNELAQIAEIVDFIDIMTYDFNGSWQSTSAHNAPLYFDPLAEEAGVPSPSALNVKHAIEGHLNAGVPKDKLVMGLPFYGRSWASCDNDADAYNGGYYQNCEGAGNGTWEAGVYDFDDITDNLLKTGHFTEFWNEAAKVPYLFHEETGEFVTYDNERSIAEKASFIREYGLGGAMIWELSADRKSRLLSSITDELTIRKPTETVELQWDDLVNQGLVYYYKNGDDKSRLILPASVKEQLPVDSTFEVSFKGITIAIPNRLIRSNEHVTIQFERIHPELMKGKLVSELYDVTIYRGDEPLTDLGDDKVVITLSVDENKISDWDRLAVARINEDEKYSENLITTVDKENKRVTAETSHLSVFGVLQLDALPEENKDSDDEDEEAPPIETDNELDQKGEIEDKSDNETETVDVVDDNNRSEEENGEKGIVETDSTGDEKGNKLPHTATTTFQWMLAGVLLILLSFSFMLVRRMKQKRDF